MGNVTHRADLSQHAFQAALPLGQRQRAQCQLSPNIPQGCHRNLPTLVFASTGRRQAAGPYVNASAGLTKPALSFSFKRYDWPRMLTVIA